MIDAPGMFFDMDCDDYFADPCPEPSISNSGIGVLLNQSPLHFACRHPRLNGGVDVCTANAAMHRGSVVHRLALGAGKDYAIIDADSFRTKEAKAAREAAEAEGKCPILAGKFEEAQEQARIVREHLEEMLLGADFLPEVVIAWQIETKHGAVWARAMIDAWVPSLKLAVDLKSSTNASAAHATNKMAREGYDTQAAWYSHGLGHLLGEHGKVRFAYLFTENDAPHASQGFELDEAWLSSAWDLCEEGVDLFARCMKAGKWPGYPRQPQLLSPPDWLIRERMFRGFARHGLEDNLEGIAA